MSTPTQAVIGRRRPHAEISTTTDAAPASSHILSPPSSVITPALSSHHPLLANLISPMAPSHIGLRPRSPVLRHPLLANMISPDAPSLASSNDSQTTPLYARFNLSQRSHNSSLAWITDEEEEEVEVDADAFDSAFATEEDEEEQEQHGNSSNHSNSSNDVNNDEFPHVLVNPELPDLGALLAGENPWQVLSRMAKHNRTMMTPTQKVQDLEKPGRTVPTKLWTLCDDRTMQKHHIDLLNADVAHMGHKRVGLLCCTEKYETKEEAERKFQIYNGERLKKRTKLSGRGYWSLYFSVTDLNGVWSALVSQCFFWGDQYASSFLLDLVTQERSVAEYKALQISRCGSASLELGFDTICKLVDRGDMDEDVLCCRLRVDLPSECRTEDELVRTGKRLLLTLPKTCRGPILFCPSEHTEKEKDSGDIPTQRQHEVTCTYRMCAEKVSEHVDAMSLSKPTPLKTNEPQFIRDDDSDVDGRTSEEYVLYRASGLVWVPCRRDR